jgi:hypothetical protein
MLDVLGFADDLKILGEDKESVVQITITLINEAKQIGLAMNEEKTVVMEAEISEDKNFKIENYVFKKTQSLKYAKIAGNNNWNSEFCN